MKLSRRTLVSLLPVSGAAWWGEKSRASASTEQLVTGIYEQPIVNLAQGETIHAAGYYTRGDGGEGSFIWDAGSVAADDNGTVLMPKKHTGPGRWLRQYTALRVEMFGVVAGGTQANARSNGIRLNAIAARFSGPVFMAGSSTYWFDKLLIKKAGFWFEGTNYQSLSVSAVTNPVAFGAPTLKCSSSTGDAITITHTAVGSGLRGLAVDTSLMRRGDGRGIVFSSDRDARPTTFLDRVLVHGGGNALIHIEKGHKGTYLRYTFARGGRSRESRMANYGLHNKAIDVKLEYCFFAFCQRASVLDTGGASRYTFCDLWGSAVNLVLNGSSSSYWMKCHFDNADGNAIVIKNSDFASFEMAAFNNNGRQTRSADVKVTGACRGCSFHQSLNKGSSDGSVSHAYEDDTGNLVHLSGVFINPGYSDLLNDIAIGSWRYTGLMSVSGVGPTRLLATTPREFNVNPYFTSYNASTNSPEGWKKLGAGNTSQILTDELPQGFTSGLQITTRDSSSAGLMIDFSDINGENLVQRYANQLIRVQGYFKAIGWAGQKVLIFDGQTNHEKKLTELNRWKYIGFVARIAAQPTKLEVSLLISKSAGKTEGKLLCTAVSLMAV